MGSLGRKVAAEAREGADIVSGRVLPIIRKATRSPPARRTRDGAPTLITGSETRGGAPS